jgi:preprotein translocase subunit SecA
MQTVEKIQQSNIEKMVYLEILDNGWREHLYQMDILKTGIGLRGYNQKDPLTEYKKESYDMFVSFIESIKIETTKMLQLIQIKDQDELDETLLRQKESLESNNQNINLSNQQEDTTLGGQKRVPRNSPCPCGSGKKYKNCCGKSGPKKGPLAIS